MTEVNIQAEFEAPLLELTAQVAALPDLEVRAEVAGAVSPALTAQLAVVDVNVSIIGASSEPDVDFLLVYKTAKL